jgi:hypothetical protein
VQNPSSVGVAERLDLGMERTALMSSARRCEGAEAGSERLVGERVRARREAWVVCNYCRCDLVTGGE